MAPDPTPDWLNAVTRSFDDNPELQLAAKQQLAELVANADPDQLGALAERLDAVDAVPAKKHKLLRRLPMVLAVAVALIAGIPTAIQYMGLHSFINSMGVTTTKRGASNPTDQLRARLTPEQRLYVFGDSTQPTPELAAKALWESRPDNPALFADYLGTCDPLPANLLETARQVDPDNGWFLLIKAGELAEHAVEKRKRPWSGPREDRPKRADWTIKDEAKFLEALALIEEAVAKPRLEHYNSALLKERLEILPPEHNFSSRIARLTFAAGSNSGNIFDLLRIADIISAKAFILGNDQDADALRDLIATADALCRRIADQDGNLVFQLVKLAITAAIHDHLVEACERCGMTDDADRLGRTLEAVRAIRRKDGGWTDEESSRVEKHGDMLAGLALPAVGQMGVPPVPLEDLAPGRKMNYALADRVLRWVLAINLLFATGIALVLPRLKGAMSCRLSQRFAELPDRTDWIWILGLGTIAPLAWFMVISHLTPLGCRDWSLGFFLFQPLATQYSLTLYLVIFANLAVARWRLGNRASSLGFANRRPLLGLLPLALLGLAIPAAGLIRHGSASALYAAAAVISLCSLWGLFLVGRSLFGKAHPHHAPRRAAIATILAPALALASLTALACIPSTYHAERHWLAQDELMRTSPENFGMSRTEREACELVQAKLQAALGAKPQ